MLLNWSYICHVISFVLYDQMVSSVVIYLSIHIYVLCPHFSSIEVYVLIYIHIL